MPNQAQTLAEQGKAEFQKKQYAAAAAHFQQCLDLLQTEGTSTEVAEARNNLSVALLHSGNAQAALEAVLGTEETFALAGDQQKQNMDHRQANADVAVRSATVATVQAHCRQTAFYTG